MGSNTINFTLSIAVIFFLSLSVGKSSANGKSFWKIFGKSNRNLKQSANDKVILESPQVTNWGEWGPFENCPSGFIVTGFQLKVEPMSHNIDNTAVNGVRFSCGAPHPHYKEVKTITSLQGTAGKEQHKQFCKGYAVGFQLESQIAQPEEKDDVAATNMKLICHDGEELVGYGMRVGHGQNHHNKTKKSKGKGDHWYPGGGNNNNNNGGNGGHEQYPGTMYTERQICPSKNSALCGLQTQVEEQNPQYDDSALNNIRVRCCELEWENEKGSDSKRSLKQRNSHTLKRKHA